MRKEYAASVAVRDASSGLPLGSHRSFDSISSARPFHTLSYLQFLSMLEISNEDL